MTNEASTSERSTPPDRQDLAEILSRLGEVGSVELKMNVPPDQRAGLRGLNLDFLDGRIREVYFFDTPELTLFQHGVVPRARRTQGAPDDTVVKLRPVQLDELPKKVRSSKNLKVEMDITKDSFVVSASLKGEQKVGAVRAVTSGGNSLEKLFSKEQRSLFRDHAPAGVGWSDLVPLGPAYVVFLKYSPERFGRRLTIEQWHYPGEVPLVELSTKCKPPDVLAVWEKAVAFLAEFGLSPEGEQQPKTRKALEYFARQR